MDSASLQSTDSDSEDLASIEDEEIRQIGSNLSRMIDHICDEHLEAESNLLEQNAVPEDWYQSFFRSFVPSQAMLQHDFASEILPGSLFQYTDEHGRKYDFKVLDRRTNRLIGEQMPSYQKHAMRILFHGAFQRGILHTKPIKRFFEKQTHQAQRMFDDPKSTRRIPWFVRAYQIDLRELLYSNLDHYKSFNQFFYRQLKPGARPIADPNDPKTIVSSADCRLMIFNNIDDATRLWIKGRRFSLGHLFDDEKLAKEFDGGSIAVFRLAPNDYHRFHSPIEGRIEEQIRKISGTYYTVNPVAIRQKIDVLTKNERKLMIIESDVFEKIAFVAIGALLVGSVNFTVHPKQSISKGDELGYFAYGGSTVVVVFKAGMVKWDDDLEHNSNNAMETLVRVGERIGRRTTEEENEEYRSTSTRFSQKNATISQLFSHFPAGHLTKQ